MAPQRVWLITGCSSGIGRAFIKEVVERGDRVIATARNISSLDELKGHNVQVLQLDVTESETISTKIQEAIKLFGRIDVLVNNAGYVQSGVWEELSHDQALAQFNTNFFGPMNLARAILPHMRERKSGTIIFMGSIAGWKGGEAGGLYSASKFALEGAAESLQREVSIFGIDVHLIILGQFRTDALTKKKLSRPAVTVPEYDDLVAQLLSRHKAAQGKQPGSPEKAARRILDLVRREGHFEGKASVPMRVCLGSDSVATVRKKCQDTLDILADYEEVSQSTDIPGSDMITNYG